MNAAKQIEWLPEEVQALSQLQLQICEARAWSKSTNYTELAIRFGLSAQSSISTCMKKTLSGNYWDASSGAGPVPYLSNAKSI